MCQHLLVKTSSLGDVVHMLPALSDAARAMPSTTFDWVVEENFAEVPRWHTQVNQVLPVAIRRWRKSLFDRQAWRQISDFKASLQERGYSKIIDSQGLLKSALICRGADGESYGYDRYSIREPLASFFYQHKITVPFDEHAVTRNRLLLGQVLGYEPNLQQLDYGIAKNALFKRSLTALFTKEKLPSKYIIAFHGTSRRDKEWPLAAWQHFLPAIEAAGYVALLPWGNDDEYQRAKTLEFQHRMVQVLPRCSLTQLAGLIHHSSAVIGMDTGLMHVAAAFEKKGIALYPVTQPDLTGVLTAENTIISIGGQAALDADAVTVKMLKLLR